MEQEVYRGGRNVYCHGDIEALVVGTARAHRMLEERDRDHELLKYARVTRESFDIRGEFIKEFIKRFGPDPETDDPTLCLPNYEKALHKALDAISD